MMMLTFPSIAASRYAGDAGRAGPPRPRHGQAQRGGGGQKVRLRGRLLLREPLVVAEDQTETMVPLRRAILLTGRQGGSRGQGNRF